MSDKENARAIASDAGVQSGFDRLVTSRFALLLIGIASFLEAIFIPIPLEVLLVPYMLARREQVWIIASVVTLGCLLAAGFGYWLGYIAFDALEPWLIEHFGWGEAFERFRVSMEEQGFWAILMVGIVPVPFQVAMLSAGASGYPFALFLLAAAIARSIRYFGLALLVMVLGERALRLWQKHKLSFALGLGMLVALVWGLATWLKSL